jgi:hypothetical protein
MLLSLLSSLSLLLVVVSGAAVLMFQSNRLESFVER